MIVHACRPLHAPPPPFSTAEERHALGRAIVYELFMDGEDPLLDLQQLGSLGWSLFIA